MKYELIQKTTLPNGVTTETIDTAPVGTTGPQALAYFNEMLVGTNANASRVSRLYKCEVRGSVELFEIVGNDTKTLLRRAEYEYGAKP